MRLFGFNLTSVTRVWNLQSFLETEKKNRLIFIRCRLRFVQNYLRSTHILRRKIEILFGRKIRQSKVIKHFWISAVIRRCFQVKTLKTNVCLEYICFFFFVSVLPLIILTCCYFCHKPCYASTWHYWKWHIAKIREKNVFGVNTRKNTSLFEKKNRWTS